MTMKRVLAYLGMGSCVSSGDQIRSDGLNSTIKDIKFLPAFTKTDSESPPSVMVKTTISFHAFAQQPKAGSKEETFFDSKAWLDSEDEDDFVSVNGDTSPIKQMNNDGDQGRKLKELFLDSSFGRDSQISFKANSEVVNKDQKSMISKIERKKTDRSSQRCLSLVRSLSCGDRKKRLRTSHIEVVG